MFVMPFSHNRFWITYFQFHLACQKISSKNCIKDYAEMSCAAWSVKTKILTTTVLNIRHSTGFKTQEILKHITKHVILLSEKVTQSPNWVYHIHYHNDETPLLHK